MLREEGTIAAVAILPSPWPPRTPQPLLVQERDNARVALLADPSGQIVVTLGREFVERKRAFGPLEVPGAARVILIVTWSRTHIALRINGV